MQSNNFVCYPKEANIIDALDNGIPQFLFAKVSAEGFCATSFVKELQNDNQITNLLESVSLGENKGRYTIIASYPDYVIKSQNGELLFNEDIQSHESSFVKQDEAPLTFIRNIIKQSEIKKSKELSELPLDVMLIGYFGWECAKWVEPSLVMNNDDELDIAEMIFFRPSLFVIYDNIFDRIYLITTLRNKHGITAQEVYNQGISRINKAYDMLCNSVKNNHFFNEANMENNADIEFKQSMTKSEFTNMVLECKEHINAGDVFQIVPSQRFSAPFNENPLSFYRALRRINPSPYMFYLDFIDFQLAGASPEIMVNKSGDKITIRPLAGSRPRGVDDEQDKVLEQELLSDEKERAEHLMLIDLARNDVGRVAKTDSVEVTKEFFVERYSHIMHIVSNVEGTIRDDLDAMDVIMAALPAGTVSGAPKIMAMNLIDKLENIARRFYAGTVGYIGYGGDVDSCIALRSACIKNGNIYAQAGAGIVFDSEPEKEYEETINKAKAVFKAASSAKYYRFNE